MSDTNRIKLSYVKEVDWAVVPSAPLTDIRYTSESLAHSISTVASEEIRSDRQVTDLITNDASTEGGVNFEMSKGSPPDDFIEGALWSTWGNGEIINWTNDAAAVASTNSFDTTVGDFTAIGGLAVGVEIIVSGFTKSTNNGTAKISAIVANKLTVTGLTLVDEAKGAAKIFAVWGPVKKTFTTADIKIDAADLYVYESVALDEFITAGFRVGQKIMVSGWATADNNGIKTVKTVTADKLTIEETLVAEAAVGITMIANAVVNISSSDITAASTGDYTGTFTTAGAIDWIVEGIQIGQWVESSGWLTTAIANNTFYRVSAVTSTILTLEGAAVSAKAAGDTIAIVGSMIRNGVTEHTYTIERELTDIIQFFTFRGMAINTFNLTVSAGAIVTGSVEFIGGPIANTDIKQVTSGTGTSIAAPTSDVVNAVSNVGQVMEGASFAAAPSSLLIQEISLAIGNNIRGIKAIGTLGNADIGSGVFDVAGTMNALFMNETTYEKFLAGDESALTFRISDSDGNTMIITLPRIKFSSADAGKATGSNTDVVQNCGLVAIRDSATGATIQVDSFCS